MASLREPAGGRADLVAEVAGIFEGTSEGEMDEPLARQGLRMLLSQDPDITSIQEDRDGKEAVKAILKTQPDLVFLDVQMPEMNGFAVLQEIGVEQMPARRTHDKLSTCGYVIRQSHVWRVAGPFLAPRDSGLGTTPVRRGRIS